MQLGLEKDNAAMVELDSQMTKLKANIITQAATNYCIVKVQSEEAITPLRGQLPAVHSNGMLRVRSTTSSLRLRPCHSPPTP
jgi:hypothetical protein